MLRISLMLVCMGLLTLPAYAGDITDEVAKLNLSQEQLFKMGEQIFNTDGANTCLKCHGKGGHGGDQAGAADLRHPRTWRSYQALGGDEAFKANKEKFLQDMEDIIVDLIRNGATTWNLRFARMHKDIKMDWSHVSIPNKANKYDSMMKGLTSGPMKDAMKTMTENLEKEGKKLSSAQERDVAAVSDFIYIRSFDDGSELGNVFK